MLENSVIRSVATLTATLDGDRTSPSHNSSCCHFRPGCSCPRARELSDNSPRHATAFH